MGGGVSAPGVRDVSKEKRAREERSEREKKMDKGLEHFSLCVYERMFLLKVATLNIVSISKLLI